MGKKAGCVPVRRRTGASSSSSATSSLDAWEVLLVQSLWKPEIWLFPKGGVESNESAKQAAVRETEEEGGVVGELGPKLGAWTYQRSVKQKIKVWLLYVTNEHGPDSKQWKERKTRRREWHSFSSARARIMDVPMESRRPELLEMLEKAEEILKGGTRRNSCGGDSDDD